MTEMKENTIGQGQREIKFRAWDKNEKSMFPVFDLRWKTNGDFLGGGDTWFQERFMAPAEKWSFDIMQYTGLKDKNGKEIYEGDIVRCVGFDFVATKEVKYKAPRFSPFHHEDTINMHWEIIGNIYENPELLSEK